MVPFDAPSGTVTGNGRPAGGPFAVADPRERGPRFNHVLRLVRWDEPSGAVASGVGPSSGGVSVADPRIAADPGRHLSKFRVERWVSPAHAVTGSDRVGSGAPSVADPRHGNWAKRPGLYGVQRWEDPSKAVTGAGRVSGSNAAVAVADPRGFDPTSVPDPPPVIVAEDGTWHRPLTTFELAALQDFPLFDAAGKPLVLAGASHGRWREGIGNAVPRGAARAIGEALLASLLGAGARSDGFTLNRGDVWVRREGLAT